MMHADMLHEKTSMSFSLCHGALLDIQNASGGVLRAALEARSFNKEV